MSRNDMTVVSNGNYTVKEITAKEARCIVKAYHYSGKVVSNSKIHLGVFDNQGNLVGCLQYGPPMNGLKTASKISDSPQMMELNRMVMDNAQPRNSESQSISLCNKWLRHNTDLKYILSFSDGKQGNCGYIYQATNWMYLGYILSDSFYELDGDVKHAVTVWHQYKEKHPLRDTHTTDEILCTHFDNVSRILCKQHIYVFNLRGKSVSFKFCPKPYPKKDKEVCVLQRKWIKQNGVAVKITELFTEEDLQPIF